MVQLRGSAVTQQPSRRMRKKHLGRAVLSAFHSPQATDTDKVSKDWLDHFGNLALVSRSINSEYGNLPYNENASDFLTSERLKKDLTL